MMGSIHTLRPRRHSAASAHVRAAIEDAAQSALETADRLVALLDDMGGFPDEEGGDAEPSLGGPEDDASRVVWLRRSGPGLDMTQAKADG